jgi:hypothetical protein
MARSLIEAKKGNMCSNLGDMHIGNRVYTQRSLIQRMHELLSYS